MATQKKGTLSEAERAAVKERSREQRSSQKRDKLEKELLAKIAEMTADEQQIARRMHELILEAAPGLTPKTWYGQPAYADEAGKVIVFFHAASKYGTRYCTLGFNEDAQLDEGTMWPTSYAVTGLTEADEDTVRELVRRAVG